MEFSTDFLFVCDASIASGFEIDKNFETYFLLNVTCSIVLVSQPIHCNPEWLPHTESALAQFWFTPFLNFSLRSLKWYTTNFHQIAEISMIAAITARIQTKCVFVWFQRTWYICWCFLIARLKNIYLISFWIIVSII